MECDSVLSEMVDLGEVSNWACSDAMPVRPVQSAIAAASDKANIGVAPQALITPIGCMLQGMMNTHNQTAQKLWGVIESNQQAFKHEQSQCMKAYKRLGDLEKGHAQLAKDHAELKRRVTALEAKQLHPTHKGVQSAARIANSN